MVQDTTLRQIWLLFQISSSDVSYRNVSFLRNSLKFFLFEQVSCSLGLINFFENFRNRKLHIFWLMFQNYGSHSCRDIRVTKSGRSGRFWLALIDRNFYYTHSEYSEITTIFGKQNPSKAISCTCPFGRLDNLRFIYPHLLPWTATKVSNLKILGN